MKNMVMSMLVLVGFVVSSFSAYAQITSYITDPVVTLTKGKPTFTWMQNISAKKVLISKMHSGNMVVIAEIENPGIGGNEVSFSSPTDGGLYHESGDTYYWSVIVDTAPLVIYGPINPTYRVILMPVFR